ncbi:MAG: alpha/beta hydrolase [Dehalococcoidales bacterium]|nr:MAG: alpha/beta hydrolase [Dehalococcoidales bacterium]
MEKDRTKQQIILTDQRSLGYAEYGAPDGKPVFYFHGFPGSRLDWLLADADNSAAELNARIIAVDRPGYGLSDFKRGRKILDWPDDVIELADVLNIDYFAVMGFSGGGPYAASCAYKIPGRLMATAIACGMGPAEAPGIKEGTCWIFPGKPSLIRKLILILSSMGLRKNPDQFLARSKKALPEKEGLLLDQPEVAKAYIDMLREAFQSGIRGANQEASLYTRPWEFRLQDITTEIHLWHGELDLSVPISVGRYVADAIPNCHAIFLEDEAHISLPYNHIKEILSVLLI